MKLTEKLDSIREGFPACETVAYADISTNTVLSSSAQTQLHQEHLNDLCETAVDMLSGQAAKDLALVWQGSQSAQSGVFQAIIIEPDTVGIFLRSTIDPNEALCCVCSPAIDIAAFISGARLHLEEIGQDK